MTLMSRNGFSARRKAIDYVTDGTHPDGEPMKQNLSADTNRTENVNAQNVNRRQGSVNIIETKEALTLEVPAPRMHEQAFRIRPDGNDLVIAYEHIDTTPDAHPGKRYGAGEYIYHSFRRILPLPENVDTSRIGTNYSGGVLNVFLPKKGSKNNDIEINQTPDKQHNHGNIVCEE